LIKVFKTVEVVLVWWYAGRRWFLCWFSGISVFQMFTAMQCYAMQY